MHLDNISESDEFNDCIEDEKYESILKKPAIFKHKESVDVTKATKDIEIAIEEWDDLCISNSVVRSHSQSISVDEALVYFKTKNMRDYLSNIKPVKTRGGLEALRYWITGPTRLHKSLIGERDLFFAIALCPFDTNEEIHIRVIQTLYKTLSGAVEDCPRYGNHWEDIGFQGVDPATDLRGVGFLGLLHLLSITLSPDTASLAHDISLLSKTKKQNFPFCTVGLNITRIVIESMREEVLNK